MEYHDVMGEIAKGRLASVYFFFGEEVFLTESLIKAIMDRGADPATKDFNVDLLDGEEADGATVVQIASSFPMMADRRIVVVKSVQKLSPSDKKRISDYVRSPLESTCLVLVAEKIDRKQRFYADLIKHSRWVECKALYENQAVQWVKQRVGEKGVGITHEAATFLVQQAGVSLWNLFNEIEKLCTFSQSNKVGMHEVAVVAGFSRKYNIWEFTDAVGNKDLKKAFTIMKHVMEEGQSPIGMIGDIARRIFLLLRIAILLDRNVSVSEISTTLNLRPFFAKLYINQAKQFTLEELRRAVLVLRQADFCIKTGTLTPSMAMTLVLHDILQKRYRDTFFVHERHKKFGTF